VDSAAAKPASIYITLVVAAASSSPRTAMTIMGRQICPGGDLSGDVVDQSWFLFESDKTCTREAEILCSDAVAGGLVAR